MNEREQSTRVRLVRVHVSEMGALREYVEALYAHDEDFDAVVNIEDGIKSLLRNEALATAYFIKQAQERVGYVILTRYHSVEKGGLTFYIDELYVEEPFRRSGVARKILSEVREIARTEGAKALWAHTEPYNVPAQALFRTEGFQPNNYVNYELTL